MLQGHFLLQQKMRSLQGRIQVEGEEIQESEFRMNDLQHQRPSRRAVADEST